MRLAVTSIVVLLATSLSACYANDDRTDLTISGIQERYSAKEVVDFSVTNNSAQVVRIACFIERFVRDSGGDWVEFPFRLEDGRIVKGRMIYTLRPGDSKVLTWNPRLIKLPESAPLPTESLKGTYRVVVEVVAGADATDVGQQVGRFAVASREFSYQ
jgi:hypothetical protein